MSGRRNLAQEKKLVNDWAYFKPIGPNLGDDPETLVENINEMSPSDVERLIEIGDELSEYIQEL